ncbi:hypothetical protein M2132_001715 [Dysgonomonas sp. PH5-45]|nr:IS4 family transposase [Dysgonomonas sp. PH5-45]MDH6355374.1 hypothetical protein [Dysgonomonas sp. PH5-45]
MFQDKFVFAQLVAFLNRSKFNRIVAKYGGDKYVKHFTCWNQLLALMFGQLSNRESLRDLIIALGAHRSKCYHLGMGKNISKSSLARANQDRDYRIFEEFAYFLVNEAQQKRKTDIFKLGGNVYAFDSTTIDLCLNVFWWAKFRKKKGGIKVHTLYDVETQIPTFFHITTASVHDSKAMDKQHLKIKKFWGTTENAVRIQIYAAICAYCLVAIIQHDMKLDRTTYEVLQILSISLTDKTHLKDLFNKTNFQYDKERCDSNEPSLFDF